MTSEQLATLLPPRPCAVPGCHRPGKFTDGLCKTHYGRRLTGDPTWARPIRVAQWHTPCRVEGCERMSRTCGLCGSHYKRYLNGDVRADVPIGGVRAAVPGCWACGAGDVRPGPCQPGCIAKRVSVRESFNRERADDDSERAAIAS